MKNKILNKVKKELEESDSFFDNEINIVMDILSNNLNKYLEKEIEKNNIKKIKDYFERRNLFERIRNYNKKRKIKKENEFEKLI